MAPIERAAPLLRTNRYRLTMGSSAHSGVATPQALDAALSVVVYLPAWIGRAAPEYTFSGDAFQPDFAPPQIDATGAKHPLAAVESFAGNAFQYDGRRHPPAKPLHFIRVSLMSLPSKKAKRLF
jgi:hypothetical protein